LEKLGVDVKFSSKEIEWDSVSIPFRPRSTIIPFKAIEENQSPMSIAEDAFMSVTIKPSDYNTVTSASEIAEQQVHLSPAHHSALATILQKHNAMFGGILGKYPHEEVHLNLLPNVKPIHCKPFGVPNKDIQTFKNEIKTLVELDVLEPVLTS
jgi:hypothetical protein